MSDMVEWETNRQSGQRLSSEQASPDDVRSAIASLTEADLLRLERIAAGRLRCIGLPDAVLGPQDLLYESVRRLLERRRAWKPGRVGFVQLLIGVMWSISSDWGRRWRPMTSRAVALGVPYEEGGVQAGLEDPSPNPEEALLRRHRENAAMRAFANDPLATTILTEVMNGSTFRDLRERHGIDEHALQAALKRIRRRLGR